MEDFPAIIRRPWVHLIRSFWEGFPLPKSPFEVPRFEFQLASLLLHKWKTCHVLEDLQVQVPLLRMTPPAQQDFHPISEGGVEVMQKSSEPPK